MRQDRSAPPPLIFLVEDDTELALLTLKRLTAEGFHVLHEVDGAKAAQRICAEVPDLVILDVMLPGMNGLDVCRRIRRSYLGPVLILTALDDDLDQIAGFDHGADDYVIKPVRPRVLLTRIHALLRRAGGDHCSDARPHSLRIGSLTVHPGHREVTLEGRRIGLTTIEFDLLQFLATNAGQVVSRNDIHQALYGTEYDGLDRSLDVYISRIRQKLGDLPEQPRFIKTVRGAGYLLAEFLP